MNIVADQIVVVAHSPSLSTACSFIHFNHMSIDRSGQKPICIRSNSNTHFEICISNHFPPVFRCLSFRRQQRSKIQPQFNGRLLALTSSDFPVIVFLNFFRLRHRLFELSLSLRKSNLMKITTQEDYKWNYVRTFHCHKCALCALRALLTNVLQLFYGFMFLFHFSVCFLLPFVFGSKQQRMNSKWFLSLSLYLVTLCSLFSGAK